MNQLTLPRRTRRRFLRHGSLILADGSIRIDGFRQQAGLLMGRNLNISS
jgi:hypothetical protein